MAKPTLKRSSRASDSGALIIIGGGEDKKGNRLILKEFVSHLGGGKLVVVTTASSVAKELWNVYRRVFHELGVEKIEHFTVNERRAAVASQARIFKGARAVFITGGDQLRVTSMLGGTGTFRRIREIYKAGGTIGGTSAGASVMSETMLVSGGGGESHKVGGALNMAPGLGLAKNMIIDQHFAQRGRLGRLLGAIAQNPGVLGIGIDEDTAIVIKGNSFRVIGSGAVYVADGKEVTYSNISEAEVDRTMCLFDVKLHVLGHGCRFDLISHRPAHAGERG